MTIHHRPQSDIALRAIPAALCLLIGGCIPNPMTMNLNGDMKGDLKGEMKGELKGDLTATLNMTEPLTIQMQMQGPTVKYEGTYISDELVDRIKVDKTTEDWILAVLGEPTAKADLRDGTVIWRWTYRPTVQESAIVEVFGSKDDKDPKLATSTTFVQFRNGIVIDKWKG